LDQVVQYLPLDRGITLKEPLDDVHRVRL
jgi:hypothetical protein